MPKFGNLLLIVLSVSLMSGPIRSEEVSRAKHTFDWPSPQIVKVSELAIKKGNTAELTYEIEFKRGEEGNYLVGLRNLTFLTLNGSRVTPEIERGLQPAIQAFNSMPIFVVNDSGQLLDIEGVDRLINASGKMLGANGKGAGNERTLEALKSSQATALLKHALSQYWKCWVEAWIEFDLPPGGAVESMFEEPIPGSVGAKKVRGVRSWQHLGVVQGQSNVAHLRMEETFKDESLTEAIVELIQGIDQANATESRHDQETMPVILATSSIEAKIDLATLRPVWAKRTKHIHANSNDPKYAEFEQKESHEYTFSWN